MEQEPIISGLREGLKLMNAGEKTTFIFPSQMAYGFRGDEKKIKPNSPLIYEVIIDKILVFAIVPSTIPTPTHTSPSKTPISSPSSKSKSFSTADVT